MLTKDNSVIRLEMEAVPEEEEKAIKQMVEVEILPPVDVHDKSKIEIYNGLSDIDERLSVISARVDELNQEIDSLTNRADGIDYAVAVASGIIAGLIDSFLVGETEVDQEKIQKELEKKYHVANDSAYMHKKEDGNSVSSALYHRLDDLAHHPTILGLVASILVRYFRLVIFVDGSDGKPHIFRADKSGNRDTYKLEKEQLQKAWVGAIISGLFIWLAKIAEKGYTEKYGEDMPESLKGIVKMIGTAPLAIEVLKTADIWIGHMMSDVSTSQGIPGVFLSLLKEISVLPIIRNTNLPVVIDGLYNKGELNLSEWGGVAFVAAKKQAMPVLINEALVRGFYFVRQLVTEYKKYENFKDINWNKVIPFRNRTVERMMTIATGTFVAVDVADAAIRSGGFNANCILRINFVGIGRFAIAVGTDVAMGIKKSKKENERMMLRGEQLQLLNAKVFYKEADMWIEAENTEKAIQETYIVMEKAAIEFSDTWKEIREGSQSRRSSIDSIRMNDKEFADEISDLLDWGI